MGNRVSATPIRVVYADGQVQELYASVFAAELIANRPDFLVCQSTSLRIGKRPCPLPPNEELELGSLYYVLPIRTFQSRLTWSQISFLAGKALVKKKSSWLRNKCRPAAKTSQVQVRKNSFTPFQLVLKSGVLQITTTLEYLRRLQEEKLLDSVATVSKLNVGLTPEMRSRYIQQLIDRSNSWRPKLVTVNESRAID